VPLTSSLYVPGSLADTENVIVDVGTGFYVEKVGGDIEAEMFVICLTRAMTEHRRRC
jgi:prefoldin alpha subunit